MRRILLASFILLAAAVSMQARTTDRGLGNLSTVYIGKGTWQVGFSGGYNVYNAEGLDGETGTSLFGLVEDLNGKARLGSASASLAWFFADNFSVGARFSYDKKQIDVNDATVLSLLPFQNKHVTSMQMSASLSCRGYIPLFDSRIFAVFGEASLNGKRGYSMDYQETDRGKYGTYGDDFSLSLGLYSGISLFLNDLIAIEISIPFLEGGYSWSDLLKGGELRSSQSHGFASYKPDFLGIRIGVTFNF